MYYFYDNVSDCEFSFDNQKKLKKYLFAKIRACDKMSLAYSFLVYKKVGCGCVPYDVTYYPAVGFEFRSLV